MPASASRSAYLIETYWADSNGHRNTSTKEVAVSTRRRRSDRSGRGALRSPGRPSAARRENRRQFWVLIAAGRSSEDAAVDVGVAPALGTRWFRKAGGIPPPPLSQSLNLLSARHLSLRSGTAVHGPVVRWKGRRSGRRQDRRWATAWSPEQIAHRLPLDFPDEETMRISHEAIYQALYVQGRGALRRELTACLRTGRTLRVPRVRTRGRGKPFIAPEIMISQRPAEAADRAVPGHWEGDLIVGLGSSAIGTLVERTTRFTILLHLPRMAGHGSGPRAKSGPALAGHGAGAVRNAITRSITTLPEQLRQSLTWDQGAEMSQHARLRVDAGLQVYFCDPHSPWQRGTNENT